MNIHKATLSKEVNGTYYAVFPKTSSDMVIYSGSTTVEDKIVELENSIANQTTRVSNLVNGANPGTNEVTDARVTMSTNTASSTLKDRIDTDYKALVRRIESLERGYVYEDLTTTSGSDTITSNDGTEIWTVSPLATVIEQQMSTVFATFRQEIRDSINGAQIDENSIEEIVSVLVNQAITKAAIATPPTKPFDFLSRSLLVNTRIIIGKNATTESIVPKLFHNQNFVLFASEAGSI
mgnify:CR=1 FL=1